MNAAILTDTTQCIGCNQCVAACKSANGLAADLPRRWGLGDGLSARNWCSVVDGPERSHVRKQCSHCLEPACVSACPVGALQKTAAGPVTYDSGKCMGCRYCMMACPFGIPRYDWDQAVPYVRKCTMCYERVASGGQPACVAACPTQATVFGERGRLLEEAKRRIRDNPDRYIAKVWGERDAGGTSVLYISSVDLSLLSRDTAPLPDTTELAMHAVPFVFTGVVAGVAGLRWIINRRIKLEGSDG